MVKDYLNRELEVGNADEYVELNCSKCGDTICLSIEDHSLETMFCEKCFDEIFPETTSKD